MQKYLNELKEELLKDFENVDLNVRLNGEIFGRCNDYVVMLRQTKELTTDLFSKPGFNTTRDLPLKYQLCIMEDFLRNQKSIIDTKEPLLKDYGTELPLVNMLVKDITEFIKEAFI